MPRDCQRRQCLVFVQWVWRPGSGLHSARGRVRKTNLRAAAFPFQQAGHRVLMVGDGVNDARFWRPRTSDVSSVGDGTDLAQVTADLILSGQPCTLDTRREHSAAHAAHHPSEHSVGVLYNAAAVPLALGGWLQPWMADRACRRARRWWC
jgi:hypothetical protein